jgi:high-affinity nickel-transport protein
MDTPLITALGLGVLLGLRHALDADHVAAVSTLVTRERSVVRSCVLGAFWGAGHTAALLAAGAGMIAFRLTIAPAVEAALERVVGLVLVLLGGHVLLRTLGARLVHGHEHAHGSVSHRHVHLHLGSAEGEHVHLVRLGGRPFLVGLLHGLAGSAALMLLVLGTVPSPVGALAYVLVFGLGSTAGMLLLSGLVALPFALAAQHAEGLRTVLQVGAGVASAALGAGMLAGPAGS